MISEADNALPEARQKVDALRQEGRVEELARALESLAAVAMKQADVAGAASALEEAGGLWRDLGRAEEAGSCLLLAASSYRLAAQPVDATRVLDAGRRTAVPDRIGRGLAVEACEQDLANGKAEDAWSGFSRFLDQYGSALAPELLAQMLQRRAAAAIACERLTEAAADLLKASKIFVDSGRHADAEACALAAAGVLASVDTTSAERILTEIAASVPADGSAAARRGLVGGKVAMQAGEPALALKRFDEARQGALDATDPLSYLAAAVEASHAAEAMGELKGAYAQLARAWGSLSGLLGRDAAEKMIAPELEALRDRLGAPRFDAARQAYEAERRQDDPGPAVGTRSRLG
jgi:hypothetical protein